MQGCELTKHAAVRANQRGVPNALLEALLSHADVVASVGGGCSVMRISRRQLHDPDLCRKLGSNVDRLARLAVICADDTGQVVTVLHDHGGREGRRYRGMH